ncbi:tachykinin-like peptides receptor 86C [Hetaerina americana]|uniref:tachykinin-like peptides receptor 86C n=1 Tax=Hetaerina americana TaxID=62018 RepID=UPI003A7F5343
MMHSWLEAESEGDPIPAAAADLPSAEDEDAAWGLLYNCTARLLQMRVAATGVGGNSTSAGGGTGAWHGEDVEERLLQEAIAECLFPPTSSSPSITRLFPFLASAESAAPQPSPATLGPRRPFSLPSWEKAAWIFVFSAMLLVAAPGNAIVIWIVLGHRRMRTATNCFLVNLSVSDLLLSLLNCAFNLVFMLDGDWPFGAVYCSFSNFVANCSVAASVFSLTAISVDRYLAIVHPLKHRKSKRRARWALGGIWASSSLLALPCLMYSTTMVHWYSNGESRCVCFMLWPDGSFPSSVTEYTYNVIFLTVTYAMPLTVIVACYSLTGRVLWGSGSIGEMTPRQAQAISTKRKVVRMLVLVVSGFGICWLPYHSYFLYVFHHRRAAGAAHAQHVYLAFYWLAMSNAAVNPLIYYCMNDRFRSYFQQVICQCRCFRGNNENSIALALHPKNLYTAQTGSQSDFPRSSRFSRSMNGTSNESKIDQAADVFADYMELSLIAKTGVHRVLCLVLAPTLLVVFCSLANGVCEDKRLRHYPLPPVVAT